MELNKEQIRTLQTIYLRRTEGLEERHLAFNDKLVIGGLLKDELVSMVTVKKKVRYYPTNKGFEALGQFNSRQK